MHRRTLILLLISASLLLALVLGFFIFLNGDIRAIKYLDIFSDISPDKVFQTLYAEAPPVLVEGSNLEDEVSTTVFDNQNESLIIEELGILAVSTGEVTMFEIRSGTSGEGIANGTKLLVLTKDERGRVKLLDMILQVTENVSPQKHVSPSFISYARYNNGNSSEIALGEVFTNEEAVQAFPRGSKWVFVPMPSLNPLETLLGNEFQEYFFIAKRYYGESGLSGLTVYIGSKLKNDYKVPIFLIDLESEKTLNTER